LGSGQKMDVFSICSSVISDALDRLRSVFVLFVKVTALAKGGVPLPRSDRERGMASLRSRCSSSRGGVVMAVVVDPLIILYY